MSKAGKLRDIAFALLQEHRREGMIPTNGRFLFYELVQRAVIDKEKKPRTDGKVGRRPDQDLIDALKQLRDDDRIPWDWIVDETRSIDDYTGYDSVKEGVLSILPRIRLDPWSGNAPMILTESRSLAGVLRDLALEYRVRIAATNGQCGGFLHTDIAPMLREGARVLYLGDLDLSGGHIEDNTQRVLEQIVGTLAWERVAITKEQVKDKKYKLGKPIMKYDKRLKRAFPAYETEAISQRVLIEILRARLEELLPESLERVQERESLEQIRIAKRIS